MWYDRIHAYLQLIRMKEGKTENNGNVIRFAARTHIQDLGNLTMEELKDGLWFCRIRKAELRQQAKGLRKVHLHDCLIDAQTKKQHKQVKDIMQTIHQEESKRMWYIIKRTVKILTARAFSRSNECWTEKPESTSSRKMWRMQYRENAKSDSLLLTEHQSCPHY